MCSDFPTLLWFWPHSGNCSAPLTSMPACSQSPHLDQFNTHFFLNVFSLLIFFLLSSLRDGSKPYFRLPCHPSVLSQLLPPLSLSSALLICLHLKWAPHWDSRYFLTWTLDISFEWFICFKVSFSTCRLKDAQICFLAQIDFWAPDTYFQPSGRYLDVLQGPEASIACSEPNTLSSGRICSHLWQCYSELCLQPNCL